MLLSTPSDFGRKEGIPNIPSNKKITPILILVIVSIIVLNLLIRMYDHNQPGAENYLLELEQKYKNGEKLSRKEFDAYCQLLKKIKKEYLKECYCKDGIENPTPRIDWTKPPKSPEYLNTDWIEVTTKEQREFSNTRTFLHTVTNEKISFDKGISGESGEKGYDHWHRHDPDKTNKNKYYLDECGKKVLKGFKHSHIRIKEFVN